MFKTVIIGAGPQGMQAAIAARTLGGLAPHELRVIDPSGGYCKRLREQMQASMFYPHATLRSGATQHTHPVNPDSFAHFAEERGRALQSLNGQPDVDLFFDHIDHLVRRYNLDESLERGLVTKIEMPHPGKPFGIFYKDLFPFGFEKSVCAQADRVILATGPGRPRWPTWALPFQNQDVPMHSILGAGFSLSQIKPGESILIVGAGMTAAQTAITLSSLNDFSSLGWEQSFPLPLETPIQIDMVARKDTAEQEKGFRRVSKLDFLDHAMDVDILIRNNYVLTPENRQRMADGSTLPGTVTARVHSALHLLINQSKVARHDDDEVDQVSLSKSDETVKWNVVFASGAERMYDRILLATGFEDNPSALIQKTAKALNPTRFDGTHFDLNEDLSLKSKTNNEAASRLHVMGAVAANRLGAGAANLVGGAYAARLIHQKPEDAFNMWMPVERISLKLVLPLTLRTIRNMTLGFERFDFFHSWLSDLTLTRHTMNEQGQSDLDRYLQEIYGFQNTIASYTSLFSYHSGSYLGQAPYEKRNLLMASVQRAHQNLAESHDWWRDRPRPALFTLLKHAQKLRTISDAGMIPLLEDIAAMPLPDLLSLANETANWYFLEQLPNEVAVFIVAFCLQYMVNPNTIYTQIGTPIPQYAFDQMFWDPEWRRRKVDIFGPSPGSHHKGEGDQSSEEQEQETTSMKSSIPGVI